ncbi:MAG: recombinase RecT [Chitinophagaceae bacterium]|nr:recombinase RecT [Chitinophagaceae bacterium]
MENNNNGSVAVTKMDTLKNILNADSVQAQFKNALADNTGPFVASLIDLYTGDTYLQQCDPKMVVMQALKAAVLKLPINKSLGFAFIVPFSNVPQFQLGYKGYIQLALRTGQYRIINADEVYEGEYRTRNKLTGEFDLSGQQKSDIIVGYFAYIELNTGFSKTLYMTREKVMAHAQKYSKSFNQANGPWKKEFDAMAKKTVLRNLLSHYGFLSVEMTAAFENDNDVADQVQDEIKQNGNSKPMDFQDADVVNKEQVNTMDFANQTSGPGF